MRISDVRAAALRIAIVRTAPIRDHLPNMTSAFVFTSGAIAVVLHAQHLATLLRNGLLRSVECVVVARD